MPKTQKARLLKLKEILLAQTDEAHPLTLQEVSLKLKDAGYECERKALYDDIHTLSESGMDIISSRGKNAAYFVGRRTFELPEIKLLLDAVQASHTITKKKTCELMEKLLGEVSLGQRSLLIPPEVAGRVKAANESVYYAIDILLTAVAQEKKAAFKYLTYSLKNGPVYKRSGEEYAVDPLSLCWDGENYYLIAYHPRYEDISHFRVDKMDCLRILEQPRDCPDAFLNIDLAEYQRQTFMMFSGESSEVCVLFDNSLLPVVIDRFGQSAKIQPVGEDSFRATMTVQLSPTFYAWLFTFGAKAHILSPKSACEEMKKTARAVLERYE
jgi:Predicted transcriptional regulator